MIILPQKLDEFFVGVRANFNQGLDLAESWADKIAQEMPSTTRVERYYWTEDMPELEEFVGQRHFEAIAARFYEIRNKRFTKAYKVNIDDVMDDQWGLYSNHARHLGQSAKRWPETMVRPLLLKGAEMECYDGQPFFDDSHLINLDKPQMGVQSNLFINTPFSAENWNRVSTTMKKYRSPGGNIYGIRPTHVLCAANIETKVRQLFNTTVIATADGLNPSGGTAQNVHTGEAIPVMIPDLPDDWWLPVCLNQFVRPFVYQVREAPKFIAQMDPSAPRTFSDLEHAFGVDARGQAGFSLPVLAALCVPGTTTVA